MHQGLLHVFPKFGRVWFINSKYKMHNFLLDMAKTLEVRKQD